MWDDIVTLVPILVLQEESFWPRTSGSCLSSLVPRQPQRTYLAALCTELKKVVRDILSSSPQPHEVKERQGLRHLEDFSYRYFGRLFRL